MFVHHFVSLLLEMLKMLEGPIGYLAMCAFIVVLWLGLRAALRAMTRGAKSLVGSATGAALRGATVAKQEHAMAPAYAWPRCDAFEMEVTGESHHQRALKALAGDHGDEAARQEVVATLVPDDANPYDINAVRVEIGGQLVGYVPREDAPVYRERLKECAGAVVAATCGAIVMGGFIGRDGDRASYGVRLDIAPFDL